MINVGNIPYMDCLGKVDVSFFLSARNINSALFFVALGFLGHLVFGGMTGPQKPTTKRPNLSKYLEDQGWWKCWGMGNVGECQISRRFKREC